MRPRIVAPLGILSLLLVAPRTGSALTAADCRLWMDQLQDEAAGADVRGEDAAAERKAMLDDLKSASREGTKRADTLKDVDKVGKRAARLAAQGKVNAVKARRLGTLSETVRHCLEQVDAER